MVFLETHESLFRFESFLSYKGGENSLYRRILGKIGQDPYLLQKQKKKKHHDTTLIITKRQSGP